MQIRKIILLPQASIAQTLKLFFPTIENGRGYNTYHKQMSHWHFKMGNNASLDLFCRNKISTFFLLHSVTVSNKSYI